jgi:hypothetical protein
MTTSKPIAPQEARDEMRAILKRIVEWNDKWNEGRYLTISLLEKGTLVTDDEGNPNGEIEEDTISYNNAYWSPETRYDLKGYYDQDELRAEIAATAKGA